MIQRLTRLLGSTAWAATLSWTATTAAYGDDDSGYHQRGVAICSPLEDPDGPDKHHHWRGLFVPYYSSPLTPISTRWRSTDCHGNVIAVPYYRGYCRNNVKNASYGSGGPGCGFDVGAPLPGTGNFGPYTGAPHDEVGLLRLGGNGFAGYGAERPNHGFAPDIVHAIEERRQGGACPP